jgi:hypothetical protein
MNKVALRAGTIPIILGGAAAGVAVYDVIKGLTFPTLDAEAMKGRGKLRVESAAWVKTLLKKRPLKRPPVIITDVKHIDPMIKDLKLEKYRKVIEDLVRFVTVKGGNALAVRGKKSDYLVLPPKTHKAVVEHEVGHLRDFEERGEQRPGFLESLVGTVWKPTYKKNVLDPEERAWGHVPTKTRIKKKALGTYHRGFHRGRGSLAGLVGGMLLAGGISSRLKEKR